MPPRPLAPAKDCYIREAHESLAEARHCGKDEDGVLGEVVGVGEEVHEHGDEPEDEVDDWVDEKDAQLALDGAPALADRAGGYVRRPACGGCGVCFCLCDGCEV